MKRIEATIRHDTFADVKAALAIVPHHNLVACDVREEDRAGGIELHYRGTSRLHDLSQRVSVSVLVEDSDSEAAVEAIVSAADTGQEAGGIVVVVPVDDVVVISGSSAKSRKVRTLSGSEALSA